MVHELPVGARSSEEVHAISWIQTQLPQTSTDLQGTLVEFFVRDVLERGEFKVGPFLLDLFLDTVDDLGYLLLLNVRLY